MSVPLARVEKELGALRASEARASDPDNLFPDVRASVATLVIWTEDEQRGTDAAAVAMEVSTRHPCRTIVAMPGDGAVAADVSAQCFLAPAAEHQVCCEQIVLRGGSPAQLASAVVPLLLPDISVVLWCAGGFSAGARRLLDDVDRLIVDSGGAADAVAELRALLHLKQERPSLWVADLEWGRLTPWRELMAGFFDRPDAAELVVDAVHVSQAGQGSSGLLLAGWVQDRLGVRTVFWEAAGASSPSHPSRPVTFELETSGGTLSIVDDGDCLRADDGTGFLPRRAQPRPEVSAAQSLADELAQVAEDAAFVGALRAALSQPAR